MELTDQERAMRDGAEGLAKQKAMDLLIRYGEALGAERLVDTTNVAGAPGTSSPLLRRFYGRYENIYEAVFSLFDLDSDVIVPVPKPTVHTCHVQGGMDPDHWVEQGAAPEAFAHSQRGDAQNAALGVQMLKTCTPYLAGNAPVRGEHCAWTESSAVVYCNSVVGARTNTEGKESTSAAMVTGKIPYWGLHCDGNRYGTHVVKPEIPVESVTDWGMFGYFVGDLVQEEIPVIVGGRLEPDAVRHKHFGAATSTSGGVELYHIVGVTPEAPSLEAALGGRRPREAVSYGAADRRRVYEALNANGRNPQVDFVMLGCPHYSTEQIRSVAELLEGRRINSGCRLWVFTSRAAKSVADQAGWTKTIRDAGGLLMTDICSAVGKMLPAGTRVAALDSAKQVHYLPTIMGIEAWFGSTQDCIEAAVSGRWQGDGS